MVETTLVYIVCNVKNENITVGWTHDIFKSNLFYKNLPNYHKIENGTSENKFVYIEEYKFKSNAVSRFEEIFKMNKEQKIETIKSVNPKYQDLLLSQQS